MADYCCPNPIRGLAQRWTKTNACGVPVANTEELSRVTTRSFVSAKFTTVLEDGAEIVQKRADGSLCVTDKAPDQLKRLDAEVMICGYEFPLLQIALSMNAFLDPDDPTQVIGGALPSRDQQAEVEANEARQLEAWQFNKDPSACAGSSPKPYVRNIFPLFRNRQLSGDLNMEQGKAAELMIKGIVEETAGYQPSDPDDPTMDATNIATMQASGPWGYFCEDDLPPLSVCAYDPVAS